MTSETDLKSQITIKIIPALENQDLVKTIWLAMLKKCQHSYFLSWGWMATWLGSLPAACDIRFLVGFVGEEPCIAFFVGTKKRNKYGFLPSKLIALNTTADRYFDKIYIEYNSILVDPSIQLNIDLLLRFVNTLEWDEFILPGASESFVSELGLLDKKEVQGVNLRLDEETSCFLVELQRIRDAGMDYYALLSANKRSQIRRSIKQYESEGRIQIREAASVEEALSMLDSLEEHHEREWKKRGKIGAFSNQYMVQFHQKLIRDRFDSHEIQLLHIFNEKMTIGYLYNFCYQNKVLVYQSGFNYSSDENKYRPGLVSHYFGIIHNSVKNMDTYDFLSGGSAYKSSLSTNTVPIYWFRFIKGRQRFLLAENTSKIMVKLASISGFIRKLRR